MIPVRSFAIPFRPEYRLAYGLSGAAVAELKAFRPTLFHLATPDPMGRKAMRLAVELRVPVVASYHTRYDTYFKHYGLGLIEKLAAHHINGFYAGCRRVYPPSDSMAEILRKDPRLANRVEVWSRGVDSDLFSPAQRDVAWRQSLGFAENDVVINFTGRLVKEKNTGLFVEAVKALRQRGVRVKVLLVGDGPERSRMKASLPDTVFAGFLSDKALAKAYASSDIFFFPSESETFGNVTLEAMASGLPAVNAIASGSKSLVQDGVTGFLASAKNITRFVDVLEQLSKQPSLRQAMGTAARATALEKSWDIILGGLLHSYRTVLAEHALGKNA
jgi:glycosyltransferase involved in cell wall biosynthesis